MRTYVTFLSLSNVFSFSSVNPCVRQYLHPNFFTPPYPLNLNQLSKYAKQISVTVQLSMGKPKGGSIVNSYQTVSVNCKKCRTRLFRYKKKNGTKSNLIKCYVERITEDCVDLLTKKNETTETDWICPSCDTRFGKDSMIHGRPAIKLVGGKTAMTKK